MTVSMMSGGDLREERIHRFLREDALLGRMCHVLEKTTSTNDDARSLADEGAPHGMVVVADTQTAGRGRLGRSWHSPPGRNLYFSVLLRPPLQPAQLAGLTLAAAVGVAEGLEPFLGDLEPVQLRWPNDIYLGNRKVAGILTELETVSGQGNQPNVRHVIVGVGLNVNLVREELPEELSRTATSLRMWRGGAPVDRAEVLARVLERFGTRYGEFVMDGLTAARDTWRALCDVLGRNVVVVSGGSTVEGLAEDIDEDGALLVRVAGALTRIVAGEVSVRPTS